MLDEGGTRNSLDWVLDVWNRRRWLAVVTLSGSLTVGLSTVAFLPEMYRSSATVLIEHQQIPDQLVRSTVTSTLDTRLQTISQEILSRSRLEDLINRFDLYAESRDRASIEQLVGRMRGDIELELKRSQQQRQRATVAFTISFRGRDPEKVANVANTIASFYIEGNLKVREEQAVGTSQFLRTQLEQMKKSLEEQEALLSRFKKRHIGELPHQQAANLATLEQLNTQLQINLGNQAQISDRRANLVKQLAEARGFVAEGPQATAVRLAQLKQLLAELRTSYSDKYPDVVRLKSEIAALQDRLAGSRSTEQTKETERPATAYVLQLEQAIDDENLRLSALNAEADRLQQSIEIYRKRVENAPRAEQEFQLLSRDYETTQGLYESLLARQKEAELAEQMEQLQKGEKFRLIESALASKRPAAPNRSRLNLMVLLLSLGLAAGAALLAEQLDTSFHSVEDLRNFSNVPILGSIPQIVTKRDRKRRNWRFALGAVCLIAGLGVLAISSYFLATGSAGLTSLLMR